MMDINNLLSLKPALISLVLLAVPRAMAAGPTAQQAYCSSQNTGATFQAVYNRYQSMGSCQTTCNSQQYAFAILQGSDCWCSNYIPASQDSTSECSASCPGYPDDLCGNQGQGLYGYIALDKAPSGTAGASSPTQSAISSPSPVTSSNPPATTSYVSTTVFQTRTSVETRTPEVVTSYVTPPPTTSSSPPPTSSTSSTSTSTSSSQTSATPVVQTSVITRSGSVVTQTVTSTPVVVGGDQSSAQLHRQGLSSGAIAGIVIGSLLGLAALILAAFLLWRRRRNSTDAEGQPGQTRPKRTTSVLSRTGLLSRGRPPSMAEHHNTGYDNDPYAAGNANRQSMMLGAGATIEPSSPLGGSQDNISSRRHSRPLVYDQRLNPSALFANPEANGSRVSMQDQQDYSRPLGIANPDYRASFDSR